MIDDNTMFYQQFSRPGIPSNTSRGETGDATITDIHILQREFAKLEKFSQGKIKIGSTVLYYIAENLKFCQAQQN